MWQKLKENSDVIIVAIVAFLIGFGSASLFDDESERDFDVRNNGGQEISDSNNLLIDDSKDADKNKMADNKISGGDVSSGISAAEGNSITIDNQRAGSVVNVTSVSFAVPGWIAIREVSNGVFGNILGAAWFPEGSHTNVEVELLRGTESGEEYAAVLYIDSENDHQFLLEQDKIITTLEGNIVMSSFMTIANPASF